MTDTTNPQTDLPARLEAALTERFTELGNPFSEMRRHEEGPDGWPASHPVGPHQVVEVLRELLAAVPVPASAPTDQAALRDRIAEALRPGSRDRSGQYPEGLLRDADMVLAVLPAPADRAAILREAADAIDAETQQLKDHGVLEPDKFRPCRDASAQLRHMADEEQQPEPAPPIDRCIHVREIHRTHHKLAPVTGCPWCTAATSTEA